MSKMKKMFALSATILILLTAGMPSNNTRSSKSPTKVTQKNTLRDIRNTQKDLENEKNAIFDAKQRHFKQLKDAKQAQEIAEAKRKLEEKNAIAKKQNDAKAAAQKAAEAKQQTQRTQKTTTPAVTQTPQSSWSGQKLNASAGAVNGPSGKETYYNLNMSGVINILKNQGIKGYYWVRNDGVKMWGKYVMVAAENHIRPRGTIISTSLGQGIVVDTGTFAQTNPTQLDIATTW